MYPTRPDELAAGSILGNGLTSTLRLRSIYSLQEKIYPEVPNDMLGFILSTYTNIIVELIGPNIQVCLSRSFRLFPYLFSYTTTNTLIYVYNAGRSGSFPEVLPYKRLEQMLFFWKLKHLMLSLCRTRSTSGPT